MPGTSASGSGDRPQKERRTTPRLRARGVVRVLRDSDVLRTGIEGKLRDVSAIGVGVDLPVELEIGEHVKVRLINDVQRFECEVRGVVCHVTPAIDRFFVGISLFTRLTPRQVSQLKTTLPMDDAGQPGWV